MMAPQESTYQSLGSMKAQSAKGVADGVINVALLDNQFVGRCVRNYLVLAHNDAETYAQVSRGVHEEWLFMRNDGKLCVIGDHVAVCVRALSQRNLLRHQKDDGSASGTPNTIASASALKVPAALKLLAMAAAATHKSFALLGVGSVGSFCYGRAAQEGSGGHQDPHARCQQALSSDIQEPWRASAGRGLLEPEAVGPGVHRHRRRVSAERGFPLLNNRLTNQFALNTSDSVSMVSQSGVAAQVDYIKAAKTAGVKLFVPAEVRLGCPVMYFRIGIDLKKSVFDADSVWLPATRGTERAQTDRA